MKPAYNYVFSCVQITLHVKGGILKLKYRNKQNGQRRFIIDEGEKAIMHEGAKIYIENQELYIFYWRYLLL